MSKTESFFNDYSDGFDSIYGKQSFFMKFINKLLRSCMRTRFEKTVNGCNPLKGKTILDIGCGPGHYSVKLASMGAKEVLGVDFAEKMINIAQKRATEMKVEHICHFKIADFFKFNETEKFDYSILMGFMDYMENPEEVVQKVSRLTRKKAFFSFPNDKGFLAWQRKLRYKFKCPLYLYSEKQLELIFSKIKCKSYKIESSSREYFVTLTMND